MKTSLIHNPWLTLPEAAEHLSAALQAEVGEADILRLALDRKLTLSVHIVDGTYARRWEMRDRLPGDEEPYKSIFHRSGGGPAYVPTKEIMHTGPDAVVDLPMIGNEYYAVLQYHQQLRGLPDSEAAQMAMAGLAGGWFFKASGGGIYQPERHRGRNNPENPNLNAEWMHPDNFEWHPLNDLPFVVRAAAIDEFVRSATSLGQETGATETPSAQVNERPPSPVSQGGSGPQISGARTWLEEARSDADAVHLESNRLGYELSNAQIAEKVEASLAKRGIKGPYGGKLSAANILREALQGGRWRRPQSPAGETGKSGEVEK
jgi:hypothetical protein